MRGSAYRYVTVPIGEVKSAARTAAGWLANVRRRAQARPELQDRLGVHLTNADLGHAEDLAELGQGEALVVIEGDDDLLALGEAIDGVGQEVLHLVHLEGVDGVLSLGIGDGVAQRHPFSPLATRGEQ